MVRSIDGQGFVMTRNPPWFGPTALPSRVTLTPEAVADAVYLLLMGELPTSAIGRSVSAPRQNSQKRYHWL